MGLLVTQAVVAAVLSFLLLREGRQRRQALAKLRKRLDSLPSRDDMSRMLTTEAAEKIVGNHNKMAADVTEVKKQLLSLQRSASAIGIKKLAGYGVVPPEPSE